MNDVEFDNYDELCGSIQDRVDAAIIDQQSDKSAFVHALKHGERIDAIIYSANGYDESDMPIDNLDKIPFEGTFTVVGEYDEFWDGRGIGFIGDPIGQICGKEYRSKPITNPTWLQLAVLANESIFTTNDFHHVFLENVNMVGDCLYLSFGS